MKHWTKTEWRKERNRLLSLSALETPGSLIHKFLLERAAWIDRNRL